MAYRDSFEKCPRCAIALEDARDVRACNECRGQWVLETVLAEMVVEMVPPGVVGHLTLVPIERPVTTSACPSCGERMEAVTMYGVELERCAKQHGVWFDPEELQLALKRAADPAVHVSDRPLVLPGRPPEPERAAPAPASPQPAPAESPPGVGITFGIQPPGGMYREETLSLLVIKIGRLASCHVRLEDERSARIHAVIDAASSKEPVLLDLGAPDGTLVNGTRVTKHTLKSGDQILIGATTITVTFGS